MIDVTIENFDDEVVQASMTVPVLVDFWAPWCAPCKSLGPVLEKLETAYAGRFKLVKIDSDQEQQLAQAFGIRSIPTCVLMVGGKPADGFQGALTEGKVREFLDKHVPPALDAPDEEAPAAAPAAPLSASEQLQALKDAVDKDPANDHTRFDYLKALLLAGHDDDAKVAFASVIAKVPVSRPFDAVQRLMQARDFASGIAGGISGGVSGEFVGDVANKIAIKKEAAYAISTVLLADLDAKIALNKRDFEARFHRAQCLMAASQWQPAMDELLDILMRDKTWAEDKARKTYVAILEIITPPVVKVADGQIPPEDPLVATYRRRLSSVVLS